MRNEYYIFTSHALDRCYEQGINRDKAIILIKTGSKEHHKDNNRGAFYVRNGTWIFTLKQLSYDPDRGSLVRVITATNQITTTKSYKTKSYFMKGEL